MLRLEDRVVPAGFGLTVAVGDLNGDGHPDIVTGTGPGGGPRVNVFSGSDGSRLFGDFFAYSADFRGGVNVAVGDLNGDGYPDIATGAGVGGGPQVKVFSGKDGSLLSSFSRSIRSPGAASAWPSAM